MKESAGTLLYRGVLPDVEVLIVHPSGAYNRKAPWSIPKGVPDLDEDLESAARRETLEETGLTAGPLAYLGDMTYKKSRKRVHCYTGPAPGGDPRVNSWEVDAARFVSLAEARRLLHTDQTMFLDLLAERLTREAR